MRVIVPLFLLIGCSGGSADSGTDSHTESPTAAGEGIAVLGGGTHSADAVTITTVATNDDGLKWPSDVEFHPDNPNELWVTNRNDDSITILFDAGSDSQSADTRKGSSNQHFLANPAGLAFGKNGNMATIHDEDEKTQGENGTPWDFMGPTMWTADTDVFDGGHATHLDMLHNSPLGMGIAWEKKNVYWVFDGLNSSLTRYDFKDDHGLGGSFHGDAVIKRYAEGEVARVDKIVSHIVYDDDSQLLYVADTGGARIAVLDTTTGDLGAPVGPNYDGCDLNAVDGAELTTLVDGQDHDMLTPSGLEMHDGLLYVVDHDTSTIFAFDLQGELVDWLETGLEPGTLQGLDIGPEGDLWIAQSGGNNVIRIQAK